MPKIIEDIENTILNEAKRQVLENGYSHMTIRSVAKACSAAVGTIYNYYPSKDVLTASFMLVDWRETLEKMRAGCSAALTPTDAFRCVYDELRSYSDKYESLFSDSDASKNFAGVVHSRHAQLRSQISGLLADMCKKRARRMSAYLPEFIAEALLSASSERREFDEVDAVLKQLFN